MKLDVEIHLERGLAFGFYFKCGEYDVIIFFGPVVITIG